MMRRARVIAGGTLRLLWRSGLLPGCLVLTAGATACVFFAAAGDGDAATELQVRIQYAHALGYSLVSIMVVATAVYTIRSQIDGRQFHMLDAQPLSRGTIIVGQWLGLVAFGLLLEGVLLATLGGVSAQFLRRFPPAEQAAARAAYAVSREEIKATVPNLREATRKRLDKLVADGAIDPATIDRAAFDRNMSIIRREQQLVPAGTTHTWQFQLGHNAPGDGVMLHYRFTADHGNKPIHGTWTIEGDGGTPPYQSPFAVNAYVDNELAIPAMHIPGSGNIRVTLTNASAVDVIVNHETGIRILAASVPLAANIVRAFTLQGLHLAVAAAVGVATGIAFTFSVAAFVAIVLLLVAAAAGFFRTVASELGGAYAPGALDRLAAGLLSFGTWLAEGLRPPPLSARLGQGLTIPMEAVLGTWGLTALAYGVVTGLLAWLLIRRKELDKLQV